MDSSILELWQATGPLARAVVVLLGGMSLTSTAVAVEKWLRLRRAEVATAAVLTAWRETRDDAEVAPVAAPDVATPMGRLAARLESTMRDADEEASRELHDRTVRRELLATNDELRRGLGVLATVGSTAPFVGLFGTIVGIINAFRAIGATGHGGIGAVSTGIAEALVTTAFGIMVAIPAVWLFNHLSQRVSRQIAALEGAAEELAIRRLTRARATTATARSTTRSGGAPTWR